MAQWNAVTVRLSSRAVPTAVERWIQDHADAVVRREQFGQHLVLLVDLGELADLHDVPISGIREVDEVGPIEAFLSDLPVGALAEQRASFVQSEDVSDGGYGELYDLSDDPVVVDRFSGASGECVQDVRSHFRDEHGFEVYTSYEVFMGPDWQPSEGE